MPAHRLILWNKIGRGLHHCHWCGVEIEWSAERADPRYLTASHLDGNIRNNAPENLIPCCHSCMVSRSRDRRFVNQPYVIEGGVRQAATEMVCQRAACGKTFLAATKHLVKRKNAGRYCSLACMYARNR